MLFWGQNGASKPACRSAQGEAGYLSIDNPCLQLVVCICHTGIATFQGNFRVWSSSEDQLDHQGLLHAQLKWTNYLREREKQLVQGQSFALPWCHSRAEEGICIEVNRTPHTGQVLNCFF